MIKTEEKAAFFLCNIIAAVFTAAISFSLFIFTPSDVPLLFIFFTISIFTVLLLLIKRRIFFKALVAIENRNLYCGETLIISMFLKRLRTCFSYEDFFAVIANVLEMKGGCSVLYVDCKNNYVLYNSPSRLASSESIAGILMYNFPLSWKSGVYYFNAEFGVQNTNKDAFGLLFAVGDYHFFLLGPSVAYYDIAVNHSLYKELCRFQTHAKIISDMGKIASLSHDWKKLADVQRFFLSDSVHTCKGLETASYFKPLVNVSGDYYSVIPVDEDKTLLLLGDVSGKGLASALVMGIALNTVKCAQNKSDIVSMVYSIDRAIKGMQLLDKYTVLFIGLIDVRKKTLSYVNASLADAMLFSNDNGTCTVKKLESNCCILGIIDLDDVQPIDMPLSTGDFLFLSTDGLSEVKNKEGIELADSPLFLESLKQNVTLSPDECLKASAALAQKYCSNKLCDDMTMLAVKIKGDEK